MRVWIGAILVGLSLASGGLLAQGPPGGFDPSGFIRRLDQNGNGQIDPDEAEGRAGFFLRRIAENNSDIDLSKPVPLERIEKAFAEARQRRESQGDSGRGWGRSSDSSSDRSRSDQSSGSRSSSSSSDEPLVPGFGVAPDLPAVPGFGLLAASDGAVQVTDDDRREAERRFRYYDRNQDGVLDAEELQRTRGGDYANYDSNKDGKLTLEELAVRYAKRRVEEERQREAESSRSRTSVASKSSSSSSSSDRGRGDWGRDRSRGGWGDRRDDSRRDDKSGDARVSTADLDKLYRARTTEERLAKAGMPSWFREGDKNGDGQVAMAEYTDEWTAAKLEEFAQYDGNNDGIITPAECIASTKAGVGSSRGSSSFGSRSRGGFSRYSPSSSSSSSSRSRSGDRFARGPSPRSDDRSAGPARSSPTQSTAATDETDKAGDENSDAADGDGHDSDGTAESDSDDESVAQTTSDDADEAASDSSNAVASSDGDASAEVPASADAKPVEITPQYLSYAKSRVKQLDANRDGLLQPDEWAKMRKTPTGADANGDELITAEELAVYYMKQ